METLIPALKETDDLFKGIYQNILWSGSFYDGLKVDAPNEYDLNIVLQFPFKQNKLEVSVNDILLFFNCIFYQSSNISVVVIWYIVLGHQYIYMDVIFKLLSL